MARVRKIDSEWTFVPANDDDFTYAPDLGMRFFVPAIVDLVALTSRSLADETDRAIAARTLCEFYKNFSGLVSFVARKRGADVSEIEALLRLFGAAHPALETNDGAAAASDKSFRITGSDTGIIGALSAPAGISAKEREIGEAANVARKPALTLVADNASVTIKPPAAALSGTKDQVSVKDADPAPSTGGGSGRLSALYHLKRGFPAPSGRREQVFISFSSENDAHTRLKKRLCSHLEPLLEHAGLEQPYVFDNGKGGGRYGHSFIDDIVERISAAPAGFVFKCADYFASPVCAELELPLLLWRNRVQGMPLYFVYAGANAFETVPVRFPLSADGAMQEIVLGELGDDRKAHPKLPGVEHLRNEPLQVLLDEGKYGAVDARLLAAVADMVQVLRLRKF